MLWLINQHIFTISDIYVLNCKLKAYSNSNVCDDEWLSDFIGFYIFVFYAYDVSFTTNL